MVLRKNRESANGEVYEHWTLCETVCTELGPRRRVVVTTGSLLQQELCESAAREHCLARIKRTRHTHGEIIKKLRERALKKVAGSR